MSIVLRIRTLFGSWTVELNGIVESAIGNVNAEGGEHGGEQHDAELVGLGVTMDKPTLLHVYEHYAHHDDVWLVGNVDGLLALRNAIDRVLNTPDKAACAEVMAADGEGYAVQVICEDTPWQGERWPHLFLPYTAVYARDRETALTHMPWDLLPLRRTEAEATPSDGAR